MFCGDHGEAFAQHEGNVGHTLFIYEENVHVPLVVAAPGLFLKQQRIHRAASLIDIAPTVLDLLGFTPEGQYQGRSLLEGLNQMALFYADYSVGWSGLRDGRWKFILDLDSRRASLFDLSIDPEERLDLSRRFPDRTSAYEEHLRAWSSAQKRRLQVLSQANRHPLMIN